MKYFLLLCLLFLFSGCTSKQDCLTVNEMNLPNLVSYELVNYSDKYNAEEGCYYVNSKESSKVYLDFSNITNENGNQNIPLIHEFESGEQIKYQPLEEFEVSIEQLKAPDACVEKSRVVLGEYAGYSYKVELSDFFDQYETVSLVMDETWNPTQKVILGFVDCEHTESDLNPLNTQFRLVIYTKEEMDEFRYLVQNRMWDGIFPTVIVSSENLVLTFLGELSETWLEIDEAHSKYEEEYLNLMNDFISSKSKDEYFDDKIYLSE